MTTLRAVPTSDGDREDSPLRVPLGRLGPWMAAIWLVFLVQPLSAAWSDLPSLRGVAGVVLTVTFGAAYLWIWIAMRRDRARLMIRPEWRIAVSLLALLTVLGVSMVACIGQG